MTRYSQIFPKFRTIVDRMEASYMAENFEEYRRLRKEALQTRTTPTTHGLCVAYFMDAELRIRNSPLEQRLAKENRAMEAENKVLSANVQWLKDLNCRLKDAVAREDHAEVHAIEAGLLAYQREPVRH